MHATGGELDLRKMSGLKKTLPKTRILILIGCLALSGFPLLAGFWSKDEIISAAAHRSVPLQAMLLLTSVMTAYYTFRLYFRVFEGPEVVPHGTPGQADAEHDAAEKHQHEHNHEPLIMIAPLVILAIGALFAGVINLPFGLGIHAHSLGHFLEQSPSFEYGFQAVEKTYGDVGDAVRLGYGKAPVAHEVSVMPLIIGGCASLIGIALAYVLHLQNRAKADQLAGAMRPAARALDAKFWVDEIYQALIVEPLRAIGRLLWAIDRFVVDGIVFLVGFFPQLSGFGLKLSTQRGYLQGYALSMLLGLAVILLWMFV
jgi:NADH-quinone oxidoreductase subunit L